MDMTYVCCILNSMSLQVQSKLRAARVKLEQTRHKEPASCSTASAGDSPAAVSASSTAHVSTLLGKKAHAPFTPGTSRSVVEIRRAPSEQSHCIAKAFAPMAAGKDDSNPAKQSSAGPFADHELCAVCMEAGLEVSFQPCGHAVTCGPCAEKVTKKDW